MDTHQNTHINQQVDNTGTVQQASAFAFSSSSAIHMTHPVNTLIPDDPYEKFVIQFQLPSAIIWQIKFILGSVQSKKSVTTASQEFANLSEGYGRNFDKYLIKELLEQIDLKDSSKASKDKTESVKITLLNQELNRASLKPEFLTYFSEIFQLIYGVDTSKQKVGEFLQEMTKRLKLSAQTQIIVCLSLLESTDDEQIYDEAVKLFRQKLIDYHVNGKPDQLPEYAVHRILFLFDSVNALSLDPQLKEPKQLILNTIANRYSQFTPLRSSLHQDISQANSYSELPSYNLLKDGGGLENFEFASKMLQPWELLIDIGHNSSYQYDFLLKMLSEFKGIDEKVMALTVLNLSLNYQGKDDYISKIVYNTFESNSNSNPQSIKKEPEDKKTIMTWSVDNLARAFRELYSNLNWQKVFESFGELEDEEIPSQIYEQGIESKQFATLCSIFNKSKPQNIQFPLQNLLTNQWKSPILQFAFIKGCIQAYVQKKDKTIQFNKLLNRAVIPELQDIKDRGEPQESIDVWQCVDLVERLIILSENQGLFIAVRKLFEHPLKQIPEYLLISISMAKPYVGNILLDELLSILLPLFLGDHQNSSVVLQQLFKSNSSLFIRGICELCKHDQKLMNLSRVLDITQEVKQSLIPIVYCEDYDFAVNLGILAGKRDFLHYDVWIKSRLKDEGTPFIIALLKYINDHIIVPVSDYVARNLQLAETNSEVFENQKNQILERSHLSKEKLLLTVDHLKNSTLGQNDKVDRDSINQINELNNKIRELFPQQQEPGQNSEEIDAAANEHFQRVFSAEDNDVDKRIEELIQTMQNFKESSDIKEQEIYACMLHGLFDEYRFLHRYPQQYLTKIAKLFGAIIKNNLLDRVLQDIALKFVIEAFRRDGRRQKFGIIVIKSFFDRLHKFPKFLEDIYQIRQSIQTTEPQMMMDIERLYLEQKQPQLLGNNIGIDQITQDIKIHSQSSIIDESQNSMNQVPPSALDNNNSIYIQDILSSQGVIQKNSISTNQNNQNINQQQMNNQQQNIQNQKDFQKKQTVNQRIQPGQQQNQQQIIGNQISGNQNNRQNPKNQKYGQLNPNTQEIYKPVTPPVQFIPTNRPINVVPPQVSQNIKLNPAFIPSNISKNYSLAATIPQPSPLVDHHISQVISGAQYKIQNQNDIQQSNSAISGKSGLNLDSASFVRPTSISNMQHNILSYDPPQKQDINIHSKEFQPSRIQYSDQLFSFYNKNQISQYQVQELIEYQKKINAKIKNAIDLGQKIRLDDLLDDESIKVENEYVEDQMRIICNNTGKGNFKQKIEELKKFVIKKPIRIGDDGKEIIDEKSARADDHLRWLIHYIITKRLGVQSMKLQEIYIEILRELNHSVPKNLKQLTVIGLTLTETQLVFKKCLVIDEDEFMKVTNVALGSSSVIKGFLQSLGSFIGSLTLAKNESIRNIHLDLKQILIEGSQFKNSRLPVAFVCRILKESKQSKLFTYKNPWMLSLLQILKEIYENAHQLSHIGNSAINSDNIMEIDSLFTTLNIQNNIDIKSQGIISGFQNPQMMIDQVMRCEVEFLYRKNKIILPLQMNSSKINQEEQKTSIISSVGNQVISFQQLSTQVSRINNQQSQIQDFEQLNTREAQEKREQQMFQISQAVKVSDDLIYKFSRYYNFSEQVIRKLVGKAVDDSIVEILPPVVDRSVTIALITTRELVLKDFAHDGDYQRVMKAADLIVQNLAGSLALVTCREPLRMSLTTNLKKCFESHFKNDLGLNIIPLQSRHSDSTLSTDNQGDINNIRQGEQSDYLTSINEEQINDISVTASRDNLELGCKLIKKEVIDKALKKVREDSQIIQAVEKRKRSEELGIRQFRDENIVQQFQELPQQLQPNQNGLTPAQFQVYADFENLGQSQRDADNLNNRLIQNSGSTIQHSQLSQNQNPQSLTQILRLIDQYGLTDSNKEFLVNKINQMNQGSPLDEEKEKLWTYVQRNLENACKNYDGKNPKSVEAIIDILSLIVKSYKVEDFSKKLLTGVFLQLDVRIFNDVDLNILLMSKEIISISEWDNQLALFFKESAAQLPESELQFFSKFLEASIVEKKILTKEAVPQLIQVLERMSSDKKIGRFCQYILETLNQNGKSSSEIDQNQLKMREFFIRWVVMSYIDDKQNQEKQINTLFQELEALNIVSDQRLMFIFCKVMIQTSIEKAIYFGDNGEYRPADRLDFRYIDSFVKLLVVLFKKFIENKHEFMTKILEFIGEILDKDHRTKKALFNQRPYYRMIMNILTAVNSGCFIKKTQFLILFSMADLFKSLNPAQYPAFCFAWLELVSHKLFLPHFLRGTQNPVGGQSPAITQSMLSQVGQQSPSYQVLQSLPTGSQDSTFFQKRFKIKELIECILLFLKNNLITGQQTPPVIQAFYHATLRVINVIKQDFPDFLSDFHFNFVNSLPEHSIQLKNLILSATPSYIQQPDPFSRELKIDLLLEIKQSPRILSYYENYLSQNNLREDLENYTKTRNPQLLIEICRKIELSEEFSNGRRKINQNVVSAVVLFIANWNSGKKNSQETQRQEEREARETFKQIVKNLGDEARLCFLNAIVNELRYPNIHTFYFSCIILFIYAEADREIIFEQISAIFLERLQTQGPYPWGLMISFRELIQIPKFQFMKRRYIRDHPQAISKLFQGQLRNFLDFIPTNSLNQFTQGNQSQGTESTAV